MKQVIVVNEALRLPRGKLAAQVAHAALAAFLRAAPDARQQWLAGGMPTVVLRVDAEEELLRLEEGAAAAGVPSAVVRDAGRTVVPAGTVTCIGLGPAPVANLDALSGGLRLVR
ncbi:MAG TPA: aminoacyl-tRNA hydrolase [Gemmatimonadaceae bacterium]|nr:aminoacyl-tRNA hydrolase [Gemmatimonadaceae bacterium]